MPVHGLRVKKNATKKEVLEVMVMLKKVTLVKKMAIILLKMIPLKK